MPYKEFGVSRRRGTSEKKKVIDERDGTVGGYHVEKWDDSQDAIVIVKPVKATAKTQEGEES